MPAGQGVLGIFSYVNDLISGLKELQEKGHSVQAVYSPVHLPEVSRVLKTKPSMVRLFTLMGGILGGVGIIALAVNAHLSFRLITSGKPIIPPIPFVIPFFEGLVLLGVISTVIAWILKGRLPRVHLPAGYDIRFSQDRFGIFVPCGVAGGEEISQIMNRAGAEEILHVSF